MDKLFKHKRIFSAFLTGVLVLLSVSLPVFAALPVASGANPNRKIVRVGYPIQDRLTDKGTNGEYTGYNVDYLNEVVKYTNWDIEYVEAEGDINTQLTTLSNMLDNGEIDMMGTMIMNDYLQELYLYPTYNYGKTYTALVVADNSHYWLTDSFSDWNGIKIATYKGLTRRMTLFDQFARVSGFTYEIVEYNSLDEVVTAVRKGEADACLQVDINIEPGMRAIARFAPTPYYFAINKNRTDLLNELNSAMFNLMETYPSLQSDLYSRYFMRKGSFNLSDEERAWVESLPPLRVMYYTGSSPIQDESEGKPVGVAASFIEELCNTTGLKTVPVFAKSYDEGAELVATGKVDIIAAMTSSNSMNSLYNIRLSNPYFESSAVRVLRSDVSEHDVPSYYFVNVEDALDNIKRRKITGAAVDAYCADYFMRKSRVYDKMYVEWASRDTMLYSVGILPSVNDRLKTIISGFANSLSDRAKQNMLYTASQLPLRYSASELLLMYRWQIISVLSLTAILLLFFALKRRIKQVQLTTDEAKRLYQFSRMVNECLIHYVIDDDRLMVQNSELLFKGRELMQPFLNGSYKELAHDDNEHRFISLLREMLNNNISSRELKLISDGASHWYRIDLVRVENEYVLGRLYDIEREMQQRFELERKAQVDPLTGIMNRAAIVQFMDEYLRERHDGVFLLMDLDNFTSVNDRLGHIEGDKVLKSFAAFLTESFGDEVMKVRLGGDEFVVFIPENIPKPELSERLERLRREVSEAVFAEYRNCRLSVSIGAAYVGADTHSMEDLYREADNAMYVAKGHGKNCCYISNSGCCAE